MSARRASIRGLRGSLAAALVASALAIPLGVSLVKEDPGASSAGLDPSAPLARVPSSEAQRPRARSAPLSSSVQVARQRARDLRALEVPALLALAERQPAQGALVLNVLWARGEHAAARGLTQRHRALAPKLAALEARGSRSRSPKEAQ